MPDLLLPVCSDRFSGPTQPAEAVTTNNAHARLTFLSPMTSSQWRWLALLTWMGLIFWVSGTPGDEIPAFGLVDLLVKKGAHTLAYGILVVLARRATGNDRQALVITVLYAISDEAHQLFVVGRNGYSLDVVIDTVGGLVGLVIYRWWKRE